MGDLPLFSWSGKFRPTFYSPLLSTESGDDFNLSNKQKLQKDSCNNWSVHIKRYLLKLSDLHINRLRTVRDIQECFCWKTDYGSKPCVSKSPIRTQLHQAFERKDLKMYGITESSGIKGWVILKIHKKQTVIKTPPSSETKKETQQSWNSFQICHTYYSC